MFMTKGYEVLSTVECPWLHHLIMRQNGKIHFPTWKQLMKDHIPLMFAKIMDRYVLPNLTQCDTTIVTIDLWMSRMNFHTFPLVVNFLNLEWITCHVIIGLFEAPYKCSNLGISS